MNEQTIKQDNEDMKSPANKHTHDTFVLTYNSKRLDANFMINDNVQQNQKSN